ncbi:hypothetical protein XHV734_p0023 (plasmid) [Xanthomonas hortorum pv. vitians]|nr:hypothetical protein XHV734_p0023 [Xanthomonas hortorum pv. vitians]
MQARWAVEVRLTVFHSLYAWFGCISHESLPTLKLDAKQIRHVKALWRDPNTCVTELARDCGVSRTTIFKHCGVVQPRHD